MKKLNKEEMNIGDLIVYKNNQLLGFNKPPELAIQQRNKEEKALENLAEIYLKSKVYIIHRLDQPASGIVLMAKTPKAQAALSQQFKDRTIEKTYLAVVKNPPPKEEGELIHYLSKNPKLNKSFVVDKKHPSAKKAVLHYRLIGQSDHYHLLLIQLVTGRHHQIRAQLAAIHCPIKGDVKYGFKRKNKDRSIHLHALSLKFNHPVSHESVTLSVPPPFGDPVWEAFNTIIDEIK
jgi:23S rRNA pseudouridine1911/1915/1917 synthase